MTVHQTYGTGTRTPDELVRLLNDRLGLLFQRRESDFWGVYHRARTPDMHIQVQPNLIPGDDGADELYLPEHPEFQVLLIVTAATPDPVLQAHLAAVADLVESEWLD
ncbi:hypothetical protein OK074_3420 [Actinobacteria bacterium OK074]|nr:hypothetical protein OK074_3420 [Actinobacteria bacterium OK074]